MYDAIDLSKYIVSKCIEDGCPVTNLQLQKLLYYIQREFLKNGNPAFNDEMEYGALGPVVPNVYYYFCNFGASPITIINQNIHLNFERNDKGIIDAIVETKRILRPWDMMEEIQEDEE